MRIPDYNDLYRMHEDEQDNWLKRLPECSCCGEKIDDYLFYIDDEIFCKDCVEDNFQKPVEDYMED